MVTGMPDYKSPIEQGICCPGCRVRYVVFIGGSDFDDRARDAAIERASNMKAHFVDARNVPFIQCNCGTLLDLTTFNSCELVM
jgi:hypothetical protein